MIRLNAVVECSDAIWTNLATHLWGWCAARVEISPPDRWLIHALGAYLFAMCFCHLTLSRHLLLACGAAAEPAAR